jgi:putative ABC transport system permease protein
VAGLTTGLTVGILLLLWVQNEFSYNGFHKKASNIIRLENMVGTGVNRQLWTVTAAPIGYLAKKNIPGVQDFTRISYNGYYGLFKYGDKIFNEQHAFFTDPSFFSIFDFHLIKGNASDPFPDNNSVVLTETTAKKYFGNHDAVGEIITADDSILFKVTGVIKDFPKNSTIQGDMFFPMNLLGKKMYANNSNGQDLENDFKQFSYDTYLLLRPTFSFDGFAKKLRDLHLVVKPDDTDIGYVWLSLNKMHLYSADGKDGGIGTVRMFTIIAILILVIACINYVNLSTARSILRAKEVSLRKIVGAARWQLFVQFITETLLLFVFATAMAMALAYILIPVLNTISGKEIVLNIADYQVWKVILFTIIGTLVISSIYPAMLLSSFEPVNALRGKISSGISMAVFRKALVIVQFTFSIILIIGTIIIVRQLKFMRTQQLGYDKENVFAFNMINMNKHADAVKSDLAHNTAISGITCSNADIIDNGMQTGDNWWEGKQNGETMMLSPWAADKNFIPFFKMQIVAGNNFTGEVADSTHFILNETAVRAARITKPVGKRFRLWNINGTIIGVVKDFHFASMRTQIKPAIFFYNPHEYWRMYVKTTGKDASKAIAAVENEWKKYNLGFSFDYSFLDDAYDKLYKSEEQTGLLFNLFAGFAIFISCLGLLGLATYTAQVRTKEIGVRKVLGAGVIVIMQLLTMDFIKLVLIAFVIASPMAWWVMKKWLQNYAYRIDIGSSVFVIAGLLAVMIAAITISSQTIKAAIANPVKSLRTE